MFLTSKGKNIFFQKWPSYGLVSEKTKKNVFNFSGNRGGGGARPKLKNFNFLDLFFFEGFPNKVTDSAKNELDIFFFENFIHYKL